MVEPGPSPDETKERGASSTQERSVPPEEPREARPSALPSPELREVLRHVQERLDDVLLVGAERRADEEVRTQVEVDAELSPAAATGRADASDGVMDVADDDPVSAPRGIARAEDSEPRETPECAGEDPAQPSPFSSYELESELERPPRDTGVRARERLTARRRTAIRPRTEPSGLSSSSVKDRLGSLLAWLLVGGLVVALSAVAALLIE